MSELIVLFNILQLGHGVFLMNGIRRIFLL